MVKIIGTIRPVEQRTIEAEAESYEKAREDLFAQVPEGWELIKVLTA